jgi:hypothetical protein
MQDSIPPTLAAAVFATILLMFGYNVFAPADSFRSHINTMGRNLVQVIDLPDTMRFRHQSGLYVNLGYRFDLWSGGEWVNVLNREGRKWRVRKHVNEYESFEGAQLLEFLSNTGIRTLPPVPARPLNILGTDFLFFTPLAIAIIFPFVWLAQRLRRP